VIPHPLIHLKLAQSRCHELLTMGRRRSPAMASPRLSERLLRHEPETRSVETHFSHREADGITVDLYWTHGVHDDWFRVEVVDRRGGTTFTLFPATGMEAVQVYHHPFAARPFPTLAEAGESAGANAARASLASQGHVRDR